MEDQQRYLFLIKDCNDPTMYVKKNSVEILEYIFKFEDKIEDGFIDFILTSV